MQKYYLRGGKRNKSGELPGNNDEVVNRCWSQRQSLGELSGVRLGVHKG